ncbi:MAG: hypothetical protein SGPRY_007504, partial [Prymnesium sp.]
AAMISAPNLCCGRRQRGGAKEKEKSAPPTCSIRRHFPLPLGSCLVAILAVPIALPVFVSTGIQYICKICVSILRLNNRKYWEYTEHARKTCKYWRLFCHWYTKYYILTNLLVIFILWPLLLVLYPIAGVLHATFDMASSTYTKSNMIDQAGVDDGFISSELDLLGITDTEKVPDQCAVHCKIARRFHEGCHRCERCSVF